MKHYELTKLTTRKEIKKLGQNQYYYLMGHLLHNNFYDVQRNRQSQIKLKNKYIQKNHVWFKRLCSKHV